MMKKTLLALTAASMVVPMTVPTFEAQARHHHYAQRYYYSNGVRYWRGSNGRYYCHRRNGTVGLLVGGAAGALLGSAVGNGHTAPTIIGAAAGALVGRSVARHRHHGVYCR
jgi:outer membrane lipoprotein SlyB